MYFTILRVFSHSSCILPFFVYFIIHHVFYHSLYFPVQYGNDFSYQAGETEVRTQPEILLAFKLLLK
jgi:hypothetical protein